MVITRVPGGPHGPEFGMYLTTIVSKVFYTQRTPILIKIRVFEGFWGVIKMYNPVNRGPYSYHGEYSATFTEYRVTQLVYQNNLGILS